MVGRKSDRRSITVHKTKKRLVSVSSGKTSDSIAGLERTILGIGNGTLREQFKEAVRSHSGDMKDYAREAFQTFSGLDEDGIAEYLSHTLNYVSTSILLVGSWIIPVEVEYHILVLHPAIEHLSNKYIATYLNQRLLSPG